MSTTDPSEQYGATEYAPSEQYGPSQHYWEQPSFSPTDSTVSGTVLPAMAGAGQSRATVVPPSAEEDRLRTVVRLIWPIALVLAIATGHWVPLLVGAIIVGGVLRRRLLRLRYQRMVLAPVLR